MKLAAYLSLNAVTTEAFAKRIGVSVSAVNYWRNGDRLPRIEQMQKIFEATDGAVAPGDFIPMPSHMTQREAAQ